ncbi:MAG: sugar ABC transporter permease [Propionicimonas sp.]|uniref:ABC transporter permease subunit n=1 Tax=Propionicimonas sp. TaxID=1955623 RepID=UPI002B21BA7A|nr:sugar ABC transporter permease [Propionicimonas sp.]MEA4944564.1 sugar ABC transporter permease [Propionicimonas sp.]MEA5053546.1 sugar ABC transporter permease [Propionicimonas sp.]MEA5117887.1 sugar ABC transporter permease [Propionicimonas sp.]
MTATNATVTEPGQTEPAKGSARGLADGVRQLLGSNLRQYGMLGALILLALFFQIASGGKMLTPSNAQNILNGNSYVLILAIGMLFVIITGQIDLSVGSVAAVVGICTALSINFWNFPWWAGVLFGLFVGILIGAWQGSWLAFVGVPGFITTLAGMMLFRGLYQYVGKASSNPAPDEIRFIGGGYLPEWGPNTGLNNSTLLLGVVAFAIVVLLEFRRRARVAKAGGTAAPLWATVLRLVVIGVALGYLTWLFGSGRPGTSFPVTGLILVVLGLIYNFIANRTTIGRGVYAVGGNKAAAALTGVSVKRVYFLAMTNMAFLSAVAGIMFFGRSTSTGPSDGVGWELDAIAAVFIGGAAVSGGIGTVTGSLIGGLVMAVLNNGLYLMGVGSDMTQMIKGFVLLVAVAFDLYSKSQGKPSIIGAFTRGLSPKNVERELQGSAVQTGDAGNAIWALVGFLVFPVGIVLWALWNKTQPNNAKQARNGVIAALVIGAFVGVIAMFVALAQTTGLLS